MDGGGVCSAGTRSFVSLILSFRIIGSMCGALLHAASTRAGSICLLGQCCGRARFANGGCLPDSTIRSDGSCNCPAGLCTAGGPMFRGGVGCNEKVSQNGATP